MIHLIHGPDITSSRNFLIRLKKDNPKALIFDTRLEAKSNLWDRLAQSSLFGNEIVILDWFEEKVLPEKFPKVDLAVVIWTSQTIANTAWAQKVNFFPTKSASVFKLTDAFGFRKASLSQEYLEKVLVEKEPPEVIIALLLRQLKLIGFARSGQNEKISKSAFVREKILDQARLWNEKSLKRALRSLLEADLGIKSGLNSKVMLSLAIAKANL